MQYKMNGAFIPHANHHQSLGTYAIVKPKIDQCVHTNILDAETKHEEMKFIRSIGNLRSTFEEKRANKLCGKRARHKVVKRKSTSL